MKPIKPYLYLYRVIQILAVVLVISGFVSCDSPYLAHEYEDLPKSVWYYDSAATFKFQIKQTKTPYNLYYRIRNTRDYPFYNLYVKTELVDEEGNIVRKKQHEVNLLHPKDGTPLGNGESLYDHEVLLFPDLSFAEKGKYQFRIKQYMRLDSLEGVNAVGFSLIPATKEVEE